MSHKVQAFERLHQKPGVNLIEEGTQELLPITRVCTL
jgi:hypothetical protein